MRYKIFKIVALAACFASSTFAQPASEGFKPIKFRLLSWDSTIEDLHLRQGDGTLVEVPIILPHARSPYYTYQGPGPVVFGRIASGPDGRPLLDDAGKPIFRPVAQIEASKFGERTLLMFNREEGAEERFQIMPLDDSESALPTGGYRFFNFTPYPLAIQCGEARGVVSSRDSLLLRGTPPADSTIIRVAMTARIGDQVRQAFADRWAYTKSHRTSVFVNYLAEDQMFDVKQIAEDEVSFRRADAPPAAAAGNRR